MADISRKDVWRFLSRLLLFVICGFIVFGAIGAGLKLAVSGILYLMKGNWVIGGEYHAGTGLLILSAIAVMWIIEMLVFCYAAERLDEPLDRIYYVNFADPTYRWRLVRTVAFMARCLVVTGFVGIKLALYYLFGTESFVWAVPLDIGNQLGYFALIYAVLTSIYLIIYLFSGAEGLDRFFRDVFKT
jgi:hypothetical protein